jgi:hypothetical protein
MILTLNSDLHSLDCSLGILEAEGRKWHTLELPWVPDPNGGQGGQPHRSCIPSGVYRVEPRRTEARGEHWMVTNPTLDVYGEAEAVPRLKAICARSLVLIQVGTKVSCLGDGIAIGKSRERVNGRWQLTRSKDAMNELKQILSGRYEISLVVCRGS